MPWRTGLDTFIDGPIDKIWKILVTPELWIEVDPTHYKEVIYPTQTLEVDVKGKMKTEESPMTFVFKPTVLDSDKYEVVTESNIPMGKLMISKKLVSERSSIKLLEDVVATGPFASLFARLFFNKQIKETLPAQHAAIRSYIEVHK
ncbi:hypothetical protein KDA00_04350 [Candidatus Saccharibacteria bacterium]|nr:hypothetical protein [Candidatus Saccharibacteria bacterium]